MTDGIELKYWDGRGLMEVPRMLLALGGKFAGEHYKDGRYTTDPPGPRSEPMESIANTLSANLGRMPLLSVDGESVGQSAAINFYLATELKLMGSTTMQGAQIISLGESIKECVAAFKEFTGLPYEACTDEKLDTWFTGGATDASPERADMANRKARYLVWWLGRMEYIVGGNGFAVGDSLTLADVLFYNVFGETLSDEQAKPKVTQARREPMGSSARMSSALEKFPKIKAIVDSVGNDPNIKKYMETRGLQGF